MSWAMKGGYFSNVHCSPEVSSVTVPSPMLTFTTSPSFASVLHSTRRRPMFIEFL